MKRRICFPDSVNRDRVSRVERLFSTAHFAATLQSPLGVQHMLETHDIVLHQSHLGHFGCKDSRRSLCWTGDYFQFCITDDCVMIDVRYEHRECTQGRIMTTPPSIDVLNIEYKHLLKKIK